MFKNGAFNVQFPAQLCDASNLATKDKRFSSQELSFPLWSPNNAAKPSKFRKIVQ